MTGNEELGQDTMGCFCTGEKVESHNTQYHCITNKEQESTRVSRDSETSFQEKNIRGIPTTGVGSSQADSSEIQKDGANNGERQNLYLNWEI